jgi:HIRAN domain
MENWIEHVAEPRRLFLAWQAPDHVGDRFRWAVGMLETRGDVCTLRYFGEGPEFRSLNQGRAYDELLACEYQGHPAFSLKREVHDRGVMAAFMRRLPPRSRPDFDEYKRQFRPRSDFGLSDFALLGQTEAKLPSDGFSVVDPLDAQMDWCELMLEVAGHRYYARDALGIFIGQPVEIKPEPDNLRDPNAVQVCADSRRIGYINRLQAPTFLSWLSENRVTGVIERLNGNPERPRAFIFVRVRPARAHAAA